MPRKIYANDLKKLLNSDLCSGASGVGSVIKYSVTGHFNNPMSNRL